MTRQQALLDKNAHGDEPREDVAGDIGNLACVLERLKRTTRYRVTVNGR